LTVSPDKCGIMLVDQSRPFQGGYGKSDSGGKYKTRNNKIHHNEITFEGAACIGGASDVEPTMKTSSSTSRTATTSSIATSIVFHE
jgi:hypothetical protein